MSGTRLGPARLARVLAWATALVAAAAAGLARLATAPPEIEPTPSTQPTATIPAVRAAALPAMPGGGLVVIRFSPAASSPPGASQTQAPTAPPPAPPAPTTQSAGS